ncbi:TolC family protein [Pollutimonas sp. H1-120]|uniref:TolC family protein n=1 Tax=Pollutimonas sp. H1-120 TaxID=3148824 RepID=UPI003B52CFB9
MRSALVLFGAATALWSAAMAQPLPSYIDAIPGKQTEPVASLTLSQAVKLTLEANYSLSSARYTAESTEGLVLQAGVRPNPILDVEVEDTSRKTSRTTTTKLSVPIELGGKRDARIAKAELTRDIARQELLQTRADVRSQTVASFFDVLIAQEQVELSTKTVEIARDAYRIADRRVEAGKVPPLEADRAQVELANAELEQAQAASSLELSRRNLSALWGNPSPQFAKAEGQPAVLPGRPDLDDLTAALERSPYVQVARLELERSRAQIQVERSKRYPDLTVSAGVIRNNELSRNQVMVGVSIPLPFFDRNQGNVYEASMLAYKSQDDYRGLKVRLQTQLQQAASQFDIAKSRSVRLESEILPKANTAFERAKRGFEVGKFGFTEVLDAQRTLFQARVRHLSSLSDAYQALAQIDRILGSDSL